MSFTVRTLSAKERSSRVAWKALAVSFLRVTRPVVQWLAGHIRKHREEKKREKRVHILKRVTLILSTVLCAFLLLAGVAKGLVFLRVLSVRSVINLTGAALPVDAYGHTNILLLGAGDAAHDGVDLTDSIMVASIDPGKTRSVALISLPRDLYFLSTENMGKGRINSLYRDYKGFLQHKGMATAEASREALEELAKEIGGAMGVQIHRVVKVDFVGFVQVVDALGGLDIVVPEDLLDPEYPGPNYTFETFSINAGPEHIDGETALKYARSRHSTSDFDRSMRQQQIIKALTDKVKNEGILSHPDRLIELLHIANEHVEMTLDLREVVGMAKLGLDIDPRRILSMGLNTSNGLYDAPNAPGGLLYSPPREQFEGASVLLPVSVPEFPVTWKQVRLLIRLFLHERTAFIERSPILIENAGAVSGSSRKLGGELIRFGLNVDRTENAKQLGKLSTSFIAVQGEDNATAQFLAATLKMNIQPAPELLPLAPGQIAIVLGKDYAFSLLQDLLPSQE